ncbi:MAG: ribosome recycling factor [Candidatus Hydrogenedentota bacterium]
MEKVIKTVKEKMEKVIQALKKEFQSIRTGRASLNLLDAIKVEAYGTQMPINQLGSLNIPEPRMITIQAWDKSVIQAIEKAIRSSNLGLNPSNDGNIIRVPIPPLTEERRKELVKMIKKTAEEMRVSIRNIRRDANEEVKSMKTKTLITEDDERRNQKEIQKITDDYIKKIDELVAAKEKEITEV